MKLILLASLSGFCVPLACAYGSETADVKMPPVASLTIRADWFDRGNVRVSLPGQSYADKFACIWNAGALPNQSEYDIDFPVTAEYTFVALYTAEASRPVEIYLDDQKVHTGFRLGHGKLADQQREVGNAATLRHHAGQAHHQAALSGPLHAAHLCLSAGVAGLVPGRLETGSPRRTARDRSCSGSDSPGHLIPDLPLLAALDQGGQGLRVEVVEADQYDVAGTEATNELLMNDSAKRRWRSCERPGWRGSRSPPTTARWSRRR